MNHTLFAYIDPATGSILLQVLAMALVGIIAFFRQIKYFILGLFGFRKNTADDLDAMDDDEDETAPAMKTDVTDNA